MNILALDTAARFCSIALSCGKSGNWYFEIDAGQRHSELLMEGVDMLMKIAGLKPADLDLAACMRGPGSFTGLRIAFSAAKGMCLALGIPLISIPTLDCMAFSAKAFPGIVIPAIDAKKRSFFTALYREEKRLTDYIDAPLEEIAQLISQHSNEHLLFTGPDADMLKSELHNLIEPNLYEKIRLDPARKKGRAYELLEIAKTEVAEKNGLENITNEVFSGPLYIRKSDAELSRKE